MAKKNHTYQFKIKERLKNLNSCIYLLFLLVIILIINTTDNFLQVMLSTPRVSGPGVSCPLPVAVPVTA